MRKAGAASSPPLIIEDDPPFVPSRGWAGMIKKVFEVDPLLCPPGADEDYRRSQGHLGVVVLFQDVSRWELRKMVRDLSQAQKRNPYNFLSKYCQSTP
jgi:hypothetical protein